MMLEENLRVGNYELLGRQLCYDTIHGIEATHCREINFRKVGDLLVVETPTLSTHVKEAFEELIKEWLSTGKKSPQERDILDIKAVGTATRFEAESAARARGLRVNDTKYAFAFQFYAWRGTQRVIKR